ncbi:hypothetical protein J3R82DRAFT_6349 [Butyriboletus roseoflavus]|nr:hypothetical protein J3R82DRAFT_6349 [Butyriboletus roseoflavus]
MENIKEDHALADIDANMFHAWKLLDPPDLEHLEFENNLKAFVTKISQHLSASMIENDTQARWLWHADTISEPGDWPKEKLHTIVQLPDDNQPPLRKLNTAVDRPELIIKLLIFTSLNDLSADDLHANSVSRVESSPFLQKLEEHLRRKRYIEKDDLSNNPLPQSVRDPLIRYFESSVPVDTDPLDRVTKIEPTHYLNIFGSSQLSKRATFERGKEPHVYALLLNFLGIVESVGSDWDFETKIPFHLVVKRSGEFFKYTP